MSMTDLEILTAACCIAGLDGNVDDRQRKVIQQLAEKAGVGAASLNAMIEKAEGDQDFYKEQFRILKTEPHTTIRRLSLVAAADGEVTQQEKIVLRHFGHRLGLSEEQVDEEMEATKAQVADERTHRRAIG